jgi:hypothetical protein
VLALAVVVVGTELVIRNEVEDCVENTTATNPTAPQTPNKTELQGKDTRCPSISGAISRTRVVDIWPKEKDTEKK